MFFELKRVVVNIHVVTTVDFPGALYFSTISFPPSVRFLQIAYNPYVTIYFPVGRISYVGYTLVFHMLNIHLGGGVTLSR